MTDRDLLLGCGHRREKLLRMPGDPEGFENLVTLDNNPDAKPDVLADAASALPFADGSFDSIHAYEVLEHLGDQGDYVTFFAQFSEFYRVLKPGGRLFATCPWWDSKWAWGDPSHRRVIQPETLVFLSQAEYERQAGVTPMSDFRNIYKADFRTISAHRTQGDTFAFVLEKVA